MQKSNTGLTHSVADAAGRIDNRDWSALTLGQRIRMIEVDYPEEEDAFNIMHVELVTVIFRDGSQVSGDLLADVPEERKRLSDCLNLSGRFLCTRTYGKVSYINKQAILKVISAGK